MSSVDHREEARYRQDVLASYRAWVTYLETQQVLLATASEGQNGSDPFEGLSRGAEQAEAARKRIAALPADKRELFDAIYEQDRQRVQRQLDAEAPVRGGTIKRPDPDEVARRALARLLEEARGLHRDDRRGMVPRGKPDAVKWLALDLSDIAQAPPSETDYELAAGRQGKRRGIILNLVFAALTLVAIPVVLFLLNRPAQPTASVGLPTGNGTALTPWPVTAVAGVEGTWSAPVQAVDARWPKDCASDAAACWLQSSFRPVQLCLPSEQLATLAALRLGSSGGLPSRVFVLDSDAQQADLVVSPCGDDAASASPRYGRLQAVEAAPELALGIQAPAGFRVTAISTRGHSEDQSIATGNFRVTVVVHDPDKNRDWGALAPTLLLADGSTASLSGRDQDGEVRRLQYLISEQTEPFDVRWQVTLADQVVRLRATLEPPPTRDTVLRTRLRVEDLAVTPSQQTMTVRLSLHNTATTPLTLEAADFGFQTGATRQEVAVATLQPPLAPDERRVVTLDLPLESGVLQIGPFRYQIAARR